MLDFGIGFVRRHGVAEELPRFGAGLVGEVFVAVLELVVLGVADGIGVLQGLFAALKRGVGGENELAGAAVLQEENGAGVADGVRVEVAEGFGVWRGAFEGGLGVGWVLGAEVEGEQWSGFFPKLDGAQVGVGLELASGFGDFAEGADDQVGAADEAVAGIDGHPVVHVHDGVVPLALAGVARAIGGGGVLPVGLVGQLEPALLGPGGIAPENEAEGVGGGVGGILRGGGPTAGVDDAAVGVL